MNRGLRLFAVLTFVVVQCVGFKSRADCGKDPECDPVSDWSKFNTVSLTLSEPRKPPTVAWRARFDHASNDVVLDIDASAGEPPMKGRLVLVGGYVMLTKGLTLEKGYEIDALDGAILSMRLVSIMLGREFPTGPSAVVGSKKVDRTDKVGIKYATPSASGYIPAPWNLAGTVSRKEDGAVAYDLVLTTFRPQNVNTGPESMSMRMVGELAMTAGPALPESLSLAGWTTYGVGPQEEQQGSATILDFGARKQASRQFANVGEVRTYIVDEFGPGKPDASKDFTGFWRTKCSENFGLKIIHHGNEGKYAVLFCGPGGCDNPDRQRLTYITGDKAYEVVGENELLSGRSKKQRYVRCSRDVGEIRPVH